MIDELNRQVIQENDVFGRLFSSQQFLGLSGGSPNWTANPNAEALYQYDVADRLMVVTAPGGHDTTITYDSLGRKISMDDPDMGVWGYGYDSGGNLTRQRDARGDTICFYYDQLNRLRGKTYEGVEASSYTCPADPGPGNYDVENVYDATAGGNYGVGRRTGMVSATSDSQTVWVYDARGRTLDETFTIIPASSPTPLSYQTNWTYDAADRVVTTTYPETGSAREAVTTTYNARGLPISLSGNSSGDYVISTYYDALGRLGTQMLGNGNIVQRNYYPMTESPGRGRLKRIFVYETDQQTTTFLDLVYNYDGVGNVANIKDNTNVNQRECFEYDALNRLTRGFTNVATCDDPGSGSGAGPYDQNYDYDDQGNLTYRTDLGAYTYNAPAPSGCSSGTAATKPHAVASAGGVAYSYDCNGNMVERGFSTHTVTLTFDAENRLASATDLSRPPGLQVTPFLYDGDGRRIMKGDTTHGAIFVGGHFEAVWGQEDPLGEMLDTFEATPQGGDILVTWETMEEHNLQGFNLYRNTTPDAPGEQLNATMIPAQHPGGTMGAAYDWLDDDVQSGQTMYYWLELVTLSGPSEWHGPVSATTSGQAALRTPESAPTRFHSYYFLGSQRIAMRVTGAGYLDGLFYLHADHLGSNRLTTDENGQVVSYPDSRTGYYPFGGKRYGQPASNYRYTGQYLDDGTDLYYYGARYYDGALGRFVSPDTVVPNPGNPQSLNRYTYVLNNPVKFRDPSGHAECAAADRACWENEWYWKNRWYEAHGFAAGNGHWNVPIPARFADEQILRETVGEAGITFSSFWDFETQLKPMAAGIVLFGQKLEQGLGRLKDLLGGGAEITKGSCLGRSCALPPGTNTVHMVNSTSATYLMQTVVHELAHVIDWHSNIVVGQSNWYGQAAPIYSTFSDAWRGAPLTDYAACGIPDCLMNRWERWAEAVTVWVFGELNVNTGKFVTSYPILGSVSQPELQARWLGWQRC